MKQVYRKERVLTSQDSVRLDWELEYAERNRWCCPLYKTNLSASMRKGSVMFRGVAPKGCSAMLMVDGL